jgi:integration host factor subunit beta
LSEAFTEELGMTLKNAKVCVDTLFECISNALAKGERVEILGFGSFKVKQYDSYPGRNPKTGKPIQVRSKKLPHFKLSSIVRKRINSMPIE